MCCIVLFSGPTHISSNSIVFMSTTNILSHYSLWSSEFWHLLLASILGTLFISFLPFSHLLLAKNSGLLASFWSLFRFFQASSCALEVLDLFKGKSFAESYALQGLSSQLYKTLTIQYKLPKIKCRDINLIIFT